jgi:hypothetical protein
MSHALSFAMQHVHINVTPGACTVEHKAVAQKIQFCDPPTQLEMQTSCQALTL